MSLDLFYKVISARHSCGTLLATHVEIRSTSIDEDELNVAVERKYGDTPCPTCKLRAEFDEKLKALERSIRAVGDRAF